MYQVAHYIISIGYYIYIDIISISLTHDDSRVSICMCSPSPCTLCVSSSKCPRSSRMSPTVDTVHEGVRPYVCTAASISADVHVVLQVSTLLRLKTWGYALHGVQPRMLEGRSVHGERAAP